MTLNDWGKRPSFVRVVISKHRSFAEWVPTISNNGIDWNSRQLDIESQILPSIAWLVYSLNRKLC